MGDVITRKSKTGEKLFYLRYLDENDKRKCVAAKNDDGSRPANEREAKKLLAAAEVRVDDVKKGERQRKAEATKQQQRVTISDVLDRFASDVRPVLREGYKPTARTVAKYRESYKSLIRCHWMTRFKDRPLMSIEQSDIRKARDNMRDEREDDTVARALGALSRLYTWAIEEKLIGGANPVLGVERPKNKRGCPDFLDDEQIGRVLAWTEKNATPMLHAMMTLCIFSGCRKGEAFGLTWAKVTAKSVIIERSYDGDIKNGESGEIPLPEHAIRTLNIWRNICPKTPQGLVFPMHAGNGVYRMGNTNDMLDIQDVYVMALGRTYERPWHLLRHSFASALVRRGVPLLTIQRFLRDRDPKIVMRYAKDSKEHMAECVAGLQFPVPPTATITDISAARLGKQVDTNLDIAVTKTALTSEITGEEHVQQVSDIRQDS